MIELTRDGNWIGVRVLQTGEEGWIYSGLLEQVAQSGASSRVTAARGPAAMPGSCNCPRVSTG